MRSLILTNRPVMLWRHGYDLRVANLCRYLPGQKHLAVVPLMSPDLRPPTIDASSIFDSVGAIEADFLGSQSWRRHLRLSETNYLKLAAPRAFDSAVSQVGRRLRETGATHLIVFGGHLSEIARELGVAQTLFDVCDSVVLTMRRQMAVDSKLDDARAGWRRRLDLARWCRTEGGLPHWFRTVTTINDADSDEVRRLSGGSKANVHTLPNGVAESFLGPLPEAPVRRSVAFWGNLHFPPNKAALEFFMNRVYVPHLAKASVQVTIIGDKPPSWLTRMAQDDPNITVLGYVEDLVSALRDQAVMVNPMLMGSGMKNKVLEAFGLGLAVVSTALGMESVPPATHGEHYMRADEPADFARAVLALLDDASTRQRMRAAANQLVHQHYHWQAVGRKFEALLRA